jgi:hypothetical protein
MKTTNGEVDPSRDITFVLTGPGLPTEGVSDSVLGDTDGVLEFGDATLMALQDYTVCETPVPAGFASSWQLDGEIVAPFNPDEPDDLGNRCYQFQVSPGQARAFTVDNASSPAQISASKTADPTSVPETGANVTFSLVVTNDGTGSVTLTSLTDSDFGDLNGPPVTAQPIAMTTTPLSNLSTLHPTYQSQRVQTRHPWWRQAVR